MRLAVIIISLVACDAPPATTPIKNPAPVAPAKLVDAAAPAAEPPIQNTAEQLASCQGQNRRLHGTTCCESEKISEDRKFPGMTYLTCTGPQIGKACKAKGDCDIACSCDDPKQMLNPSDGPLGPKDGTRGVTGMCAGRLQIGVWMCQIDEHGVVSHMIVD